MPIIKVGDKRVKFPDSMSQDEIKNALDSKFSAQQPRQFTPEASTKIEEAGERVEKSYTGPGMFGSSNAFARHEQEKQKARDEQASFETMRERNPFLAQMIEETGAGETALAGFGRGLANLGRAVGLADQEDELTKQTFKFLGERQPVLGLAEAAGESAPFLAAAPLAGAGLTTSAAGRVIIPAAQRTATKALGTGLLGGLEGATIAKGKGGSTGQVFLAGALGSLLGSGAEVAIPLITRSINRAGRGLVDDGVEAVTPEGQITPALQKALDDKGMSQEDFLLKAVDDADITQKQRQEAFEVLGIKPTKAEVTRDKALFQKQVELERQGGKVTDALEEQQVILNKHVDDAAEATKGDHTSANVSPFNAITAKVEQQDRAITDLYRAADSASGGKKNVVFKDLANFIEESKPLDINSEGIVSALKGRMEALGYIDEDGAITAGINSVTGVRVGQATAKEAEKQLRQYANSLFEGAKPQGRRIIKQFKDALDSDVFTALGKETYKDARLAKQIREQALQTKKRSKFDTSKTSLVKDMLEGKISEDVLSDRIIKKSAKYDSKQVKELKEYLLSGTKEQIIHGTKAWNDIRAKAFEVIKEKAFSGPEMSRGGQRQATRSKFKTAVDTIGEDKMNVLFTPSERQLFGQIANVLRLKEAPPGVLASPSGPAIRTATSALRLIPGLNLYADDIAKSVSSKIGEKRLLGLTTLAEKAADESKKQAALRLSRATPSRAATVVPFAALPAAAQEEEK